jgi:DNA-binding protein Alba
MMATVVENKTSSPGDQNAISGISPSVLLIGKKRVLDYIAPALFRINGTGELVIKATGSLSIVTAVDVAEMVKHDVEGLVTKSITIGTDELTNLMGERKRMSCIEIHLIKVNPIKKVLTPAIDIPASAADIANETTIVTEATTPTIATTEEEKKVKKSKPRKRAAAATAKKKKKGATISSKNNSAV